MIHMAMFNAYNCINRHNMMYHYNGEDETDYDETICDGASIDAAIATAASDVMIGFDQGPTGLYAHNTTILEYVMESLEDTLMREEDVVAKEKGIEVGHIFARQILNDRINDGWSTENTTLIEVTYTENNEAGRHRVDPFNPNQGFLWPGFGDLRPFGMTKEELNELLAPLPPSLENGTFNTWNQEYLDALQQVKEKGEFRGGTNGDVPTDDETYVIANVSSLFVVCRYYVYVDFAILIRLSYYSSGATMVVHTQVHQPPCTVT